MAQGKVLFIVALVLHLSSLSCLSIFLLLSELAVGISVSFLHSSALSSMRLLSTFKQLVKMKSLLLMRILIKLLLLLVQLFLSNLLVNPVFLL